MPRKGNFKLLKFIEAEIDNNGTKEKTTVFLPVKMIPGTDRDIKSTADACRFIREKGTLQGSFAVVDFKGVVKVETIKREPETVATFHSATGAAAKPAADGQKPEPAKKGGKGKGKKAEEKPPEPPTPTTEATGNASSSSVVADAILDAANGL